MARLQNQKQKLGEPCQRRAFQIQNHITSISNSHSDFEDRHKSGALTWSTLHSSVLFIMATLLPPTKLNQETSNSLERKIILNQGADGLINQTKI